MNEDNTQTDVLLRFDFLPFRLKLLAVNTSNTVSTETESVVRTRECEQQQLVE